jgi:cyanophycinase
MAGAHGAWRNPNAHRYGENPMPPVFLIGGGRDDDAALRASHTPFTAACDGGPVLCICEDDPSRWQRNLELGGARDVTAVLLDDGDRPDPAGFAGIYVAGGLTPLYRDRLAGLEVTVPYCGFSAGAAIAAREALVGGWRIGDRQVCDEDFSEDLEQVEPLPGLGLVPFAVDVHATQWGTVSRALNAVERGLYEEALAVDEHCCVEVRDGQIVRLHGRNVAYRVRRGPAVDVLTP